MSKLRVNVSVSDDHVDRMEQVAKAAKKAGLSIDQRLDMVGVVTGTIDSEKLENLRRVEGVAGVESEREVSIPSPGSQVQ